MDGYQFDRIFASKIPAPSPGDLPGLIPSLAEGGPPQLIAGVDEVGRGPLAGPLVVAAVILPWEPEIDGLNDSKILHPFEREAVYCEIQETALAISVSVIEPGIIDSLNILGATMHAMRQAIGNLKLVPDIVLVDGNQKPGSGIEEKAIVKGDRKSAAIMAASIIAKVTRDHIMDEAHKIYPEYGFNQHKGYGSELHFNAIREFGPCPLHRKSFEPIRSLLTSKKDLVSIMS